MVSNESANGIDFHGYIQNRMMVLQEAIASKSSQRSAIDSEIATLQRELDGLENTYPHLSSNSVVEATYPHLSSNGVVLPESARRRLSGRATADLVVKIMAEEGRPLHYREIYAKLLERGLQSPVSEDPAQAILARYYNNPRLIRTKRGTYTLKSLPEKNSEATSFPVKTNPAGKRSKSSDSVDYTNTKPVAFTLMGQRRLVNKWRYVFSGLCEEIYALDPEGFLPAITINGSRYFSRNQGNFRKSAQIANSGVFLNLNYSANDTMQRCLEVLAIFGISEEDFEVEYRLPEKSGKFPPPNQPVPSELA